MKWDLHPVSDIEQFETEWSGIYDKSPCLPILDYRFITSSLLFCPDNNLLLGVCKKDNDIVAFAILNKNRFGMWETFQPSQAPIGAWIQGNEIKTTELLKPLLHKLPGLVLGIGITQQDPEILPRPNDSGHITTLDYIKTAFIDVDSTFEEYWSARGKNLRHTIKRQTNLLKREDISTRLEVLTSPDEMKRAITDYGELESAGWKSQEGTAVHINNKQGKFYLDLFEKFSRTKQAIVYRYWYNNSLAAVDLCLHNNDTFIILKTTYDEKLKSTSPAMLMRYESFQQIFSEGKIKRIEFYGKLMDWHTKWSKQHKQMYHVNYFRWPIIKKMLSTFRG